MKRNRQQCAVVMALVLAVCGSAHAETATGEARLEQIVVTATRTEQDLATAPGSVSVVTKEEMEKQTVMTVDDALKGMSGVMLNRSKGLMNTIATMTLRGVPGQSRTLIMVDGVAINSPFAGNIQSNSISPGTLERIEVVKGASSSLYGGNAMGGVINMITQMPQKREFMLNTGFGSGLAGNGAENTRRIAASYGDLFMDKFRLYIHNDYAGSDGFINENVTGSAVAGTTGSIPSVDRNGTATRILGDKGRNGAWQDNFTLKSEYQFTPDTKLGFTFLRSYGEHFNNDPHTYMRNSAGNPVWSASGSEYSFLGSDGADGLFLYNLAFETVVSSAKIKANLNYLDQDTSWYTTASSTTTAPVATRSGGPGKLTLTPANALGSDIQVSFPVLSWNYLTVGGAFRQSKLDGVDYVLSDWRNENSKGQMIGAARGTDTTYAVFLQDEISVTDKLTFYAGFRQDWWQTSDGYVLAANSSNVITTGPTSFSSRSANAFSPKGALVYTPFERTILKLSGGKAFRAPNNYELYRTTMMGSSTTYANNPDLKPETSVSWDASASQGLWQGATIKATYFENYFSDLIYSTVSGSIRNKLNAGKAESKGVELEAEQKFGKQARLFFNYTYTDGKITENKAVPLSVGKKMTDVPEHMFNLGADAQYGPFGVMFVGRYVSKRYGTDTNTDTARGVQGALDPFFTGDIKLRYKIADWVTASFSVNNLWDEKYFSSTAAEGRSCFGDLTFKF